MNKWLFFLPLLLIYLLFYLRRKIPTLQHSNIFTSPEPRLLSTLESTLLGRTLMLGFRKYLIILYFPSFCLLFTVGSHLKSQTPVLPYSLFSGKTQFPAVNSQFPTHSCKFDLCEHPPCLFLYCQNINVSLSQPHSRLAAAQCLSSLS